MPPRPDPQREQREHGRQKGDRQHERGADAECDERPEMAEWRHVGEVHAQEAERSGQAGEEDRLEIDPKRLRNRAPLELAGACAPLQRAGAPLGERARSLGLHGVAQLSRIAFFHANHR